MYRGLASTSRMTTPDRSRSGGAALRVYQGYRYTVITMATGAKPHSTEAELWYAPMEAGGKVGRWTYFRRYASAQPGDAERRVEADFMQWIDGRLEAEGPVEEAPE